MKFGYIAIRVELVGFALVSKTSLSAGKRGGVEEGRRRDSRGKKLP